MFSIPAIVIHGKSIAVACNGKNYEGNTNLQIDKLLEAQAVNILNMQVLSKSYLPSTSTLLSPFSSIKAHNSIASLSVSGSPREVSALFIS